MIPDYTPNAFKVGKHNGTNEGLDIDEVMTHVYSRLLMKYISQYLQPKFVTVRILGDSSYRKMLIRDLTFASLDALKPCV